jgi:hypothetical protein
LVFIGINELMSLCPKGGCGRWHTLMYFFVLLFL